MESKYDNMIFKDQFFFAGQTQICNKVSASLASLTISRVCFQLREPISMRPISSC